MSYRVIAISGWSDEPSTTKLASPAKIYPPRPSLASRPLSSKCYSQFLPILSSSFVLLIEKLVNFAIPRREKVFTSRRVKKESVRLSASIFTSKVEDSLQTGVEKFFREEELEKLNQRRGL